MSEEESLKACPRAIAKRQVKSIPSSMNPKKLLLALCIAFSLVQLLLISAGAGRTETPIMWAVPANIRDGEYSGSGIYLTPGLVITAAHVTAGWTGNAEVYIDGAGFPATRVKQGAFEDVDLALFSVDQQKLRASIQEIQAPLCRAPAWPGDPVIVVDQAGTTHSHIISPVILSFPLRSKFSTLIADVATTGNSGSGVFDPDHECLLGIMSRKFTMAGVDIAKYFVPASEIREFIPVELREQVLMK
jgi:S1-C subfamily serine protease